MDYLEMFQEWNETMISTIRRNLSADLKAGYQQRGPVIMGYLKELDKRRELYRELYSLKTLQDAQKWCKGYLLLHELI